MELLNATLWVMCFFKWNATATALCWAVFCSFLIVLSFIDWDTTLLPDRLTFPLLWIGLLTSAAGWMDINPSESIVGAAIGYSFLWLVSRTFERVTGTVGMGDGDLKLLAAVGAWLGPLPCIYVVLVASVTGAIVGLLLQKYEVLKDTKHIPFGPFISSSAIVWLFTHNHWLTL